MKSEMIWKPDWCTDDALIKVMGTRDVRVIIMSQEARKSLSESRSKIMGPIYDQRKCVEPTECQGAQIIVR